MTDETPNHHPLPNLLVVQCMACFEWVDVSIDIQDQGVMVQDCEVCCRPLQITLHWESNGQPHIQVELAE